MYSAISLSFLVATTLSASVSLAAPATRRCTDTPTYRVRVTSFDGTGRYGGEELGACHVGAGIEILCLYPGAPNGPGSNFTWTGVEPGSSNPGYLHYTPGPEGSDTIQRLALWTWGTGSDAKQFATFLPGVTPDPVELYLDPARSLLEPYANSTVVPNEWYMCPFHYGGYNNTGLAAFENGAVPSDPECAPVWFSRWDN